MKVLGMVDLPLWLILFLASVLLYLVYMSATFGTFRKMGIPGPMPVPLLGNSLSFVKRGMIGSTVHDYLKYKHNKVYGIFEGRYPVLNIADRDMAREVMVKQANKFINRPHYFVLNQPGIDRIMFNTRGDDWKHQRNSLRPSLSPARLKLIYPRISDKLKNLMGIIRDKAEKEKYFEITKMCSCCAMDIVACTAFNVDLDSYRDPRHNFVTYSKSFLHALLPRVFLSQHFAPPFVGQLLNYFKIEILPKKPLQVLQEFVDVAINTRKKDPTIGPDDVLQYLIDSSPLSEKLSTKKVLFDMKDIYGASITYLLAGFDTLSKGIYYTVFQVAMHPECFKKAQKEVDEVLKGEFPNPDNVRELEYVDKCVKESTRIIPLAAFADRECDEETTLGGIRIPKGMAVRIPFAGFHHDPEVFPNPEKFDPERFSAENVMKRHSMDFLNFGAGPRSCFGETFAKLVMRCALAAFLQVFDINPCEKSVFPVQLDPYSDLYPLNGLWLTMRSRKNSVYKSEQSNETGDGV